MNMENISFWGIHMDILVGTDPIENNYIGIGWGNLGDLKLLEPTRDALKEVLHKNQPDASVASIRAQSSPIFRFVNIIKKGDYIIYPCKANRLIYVGMVTSDYRYHNDLDEDSYCNRRSVKWLTPNGIPRSEFSQSTLYELGAFISVFEIKSHTAQEILSHVQNGKTVKKISNAIEPINKLDKNIEDDVDDLTITKQASETAAETTQDYVIRLLQQKLSGHEFEKFIAHLIQCMGYNTRVTKKSGDGGVDIIAHKDALGFEPPIIKIQCKRTSGSSGEPEVSQLLGTLGDGEVALFINLGSYTTQAKNLEKNKSKLRLIDGNEVVDLIYKYYKDFEPQYRALIPLKQIFVPDISSMQ